MKVLVVEGEKHERRAFVEALATIDEIAVCGAVPDLRSAERAFTEASPDVVVTGVHLADADGLQLIGRASRLPRSPHIVVVAPSPTREEWRRHLDAGATRFVERDADLSELREVVTTLARTAPAHDDEDPLRLLGRIAAGVVHDLNNYMLTMQLALAELKDSPPDPGAPERAQLALDTAMRLTRSLLGYVRGVPLTPVTIDLAQLVRSLLSVVGHSLAERSQIRLDAADGLPRIRGIPSELEQLVLNLVLNAIDASPPGSEIAIRVRSARGEAVTLEVADRGCGLDPVVLDTLGPLSPSTKGGRRGGLGLGIVRTVAASHSAAIRIARGAAGGSTVTVVFPRDPQS